MSARPHGMGAPPFLVQVCQGHRGYSQLCQGHIGSSTIDATGMCTETLSQCTSAAVSMAVRRLEETIAATHLLLAGVHMSCSAHQQDRLHTHIDTSARAHIYLFTHVYMYPNACTYLKICIDAHVCMFTHTYTYALIAGLHYEGLPRVVYDSQ